MEINQLIEVPEESRDQSWENQFFQKITAGEVKLLSADPQQGPDGWPYLVVQTIEDRLKKSSKGSVIEPSSQASTADEASTQLGSGAEVSASISDESIAKMQNIIGWCATKGIGIVVNPMKEYPDYVFTYGMTWHFRQTGYFFVDRMDVSTGVIELKQSGDFISGSPSEDYLPGYVRKILREFFRDQNVLGAKILMVSQDSGKNFDLCFSLESLGHPPEKEHQGILEAISWFLPPHYSLMLVSEKTLPPFFDL